MIFRFDWLCLLVSSVSNFCPDTGARWWSLFNFYFSLACSVILWGGRNTANKYHWHVFTVIQPHWVCPAHSVCAFPVYTAQTLGCSAGNCLMWALVCMHFPGLSHSDSGSRVLHKGADLVRPAFCSCPRSEQLR